MSKSSLHVVCTATHFVISRPRERVASLHIDRRTGQAWEEPLEDLAASDSSTDVDVGFHKCESHGVHAFYRGEFVLGQFWFMRRRYLLLVNHSDQVTQGFGNIFEISGVFALPYDTGNIPKGVEDVVEVLQSGGFYYSPDMDLTNTMLARRNKKPRNTQYLWNEECLKPFLSVSNKWFAFLIQGSVRAGKVGRNTARNSPDLCSLLIARNSKRRAGTRYSVRGIDDFGAVAGYCETEQLFSVDGSEPVSFLQVRGSIPIFWEQEGPLNCTITRDEEWNKLAFQKHHGELRDEYGQLVYCNLLSNTKKIERGLCVPFEAVVKKFGASYVQFDFYANVGNHILNGLRGL